MIDFKDGWITSGPQEFEKNLSRFQWIVLSVGEKDITGAYLNFMKTVPCHNKHTKNSF